MSNPRIGLICTSHDYETLVNTSENIVMTGDWKISKERVNQLVDKYVFLTESASSPAYSGGKIVGYRKKPSGKYVLYFEEDPSLSGYSDHVQSWSDSASRGARNPVRYF